MNNYQYPKLLLVALGILVFSITPSDSATPPPYKLADHAAGTIPTHALVTAKILSAISTHSTTGLVTDLARVSGSIAANHYPEQCHNSDDSI